MTREKEEKRETERAIETERHIAARVELRLAIYLQMEEEASYIEHNRIKEKDADPDGVSRRWYVEMPDGRIGQGEYLHLAFDNLAFPEEEIAEPPYGTFEDDPYYQREGDKE